MPRSEALDLYSGKVPLRPIQRIGILLLEGVPLLGIIFFILFILTKGISSLKDAPILARVLFVPLILLWLAIALAEWRYVWAALTAPSQKDE